VDGALNDLGGKCHNLESKHLEPSSTQVHSLSQINGKILRLFFNPQQYGLNMKFSTLALWKDTLIS
jgi:hypothetical protein